MYFWLLYQLVFFMRFTRYLHIWLHIHRLHNFIYTSSKNFIVMIPGELARKLYKLKKLEVAAVKIQKTSRTRLARKDYLRMIFSSVVLQSHLRAKVASVEFKSKRSAAVTIQVINASCFMCYYYALFVAFYILKELL